MKNGFFLLLSLMFLTACTPFSRETLRKAEPEISVSDVQKNPDLYKGKFVIWGGVVIETLNRKDDTVIKIMGTRLDSQKRPVDIDKSLGRFMVRHKDFLDPYIFGRGRELTVAGTIAGAEQQSVDEVLYLYPVIDSEDIRLWEKTPEVIYYDPYWGPPYRWGYSRPWW